jgi:hypothetical protein
MGLVLTLMVYAWTRMGLILTVMVPILTVNRPDFKGSGLDRNGCNPDCMVPILTGMGLNLTLFVPVWTGMGVIPPLTVCNGSCPDWSGMISVLPEMDLALTKLDLVITA